MYITKKSIGKNLKGTTVGTTVGYSLHNSALLLPAVAKAFPEAVPDLELQLIQEFFSKLPANP